MAAQEPPCSLRICDKTLTYSDPQEEFDATVT